MVFFGEPIQMGGDDPPGQLFGDDNPEAAVGKGRNSTPDLLEF